MKQQNTKEKGESKNAKEQKSKQGITLIALVVTIVVLLILAGVTINLLFSDTGLFGKAQEAENAWRNGEQSDINAIGALSNQMNDILNGIGNGGGTTPGGDENIDPETGWDLNKVTPVPSKDETPVNVPVPKGFTASTVEAEQTVEGGFVIKQDGTNNEFVWIPVSEERLAQMYTTETVALSGGTGVTTNIYSKSSIETMGKPGETGYREPDLVVGSGSEYDADSSYYSSLGLGSDAQEFAPNMVDEYQEIHDSIEQYGGFYIGRYELTGSTSSPTVAKDGTVITNTDWYNLKAACMKIVNNEGKQENEIIAKTTMMYGNQWDEVLNWLSSKRYDIEDSSSWGNYSNYNEVAGTDKQVDKAGEKTTAGYSEYWKANNIYDLAGNCYEWTQEAYSTSPRVTRGGNFVNSGSDRPASYRSLSTPDDVSGSSVSARLTLYISSTEQ